MVPIDIESPKSNEIFIVNQTSKGSRYKDLITLMFLLCFVVIVYIGSINFQHIGHKPITPSEYETTASFQYDGKDIIQDGMFKISHGLGHSSPDVGCVTFYDKSKNVGSRGYREICLTDDERIQSLRFKPSELKMEKDISVNIGTDAFLTLYYKMRPVISLYSSSEKDLWQYNFDEVAITYIKDHVYADQQQIMVELKGSVQPPAPCVLFSNNQPAKGTDMSHFLVCGRPGVDSVALNDERFYELGIDIKKLSRDFSHVTCGGLANIEIHSDSDFNGNILKMESNDYKNLGFETYIDPSGVAHNWSTNLKGFKLSIK